jgi:cysteine-rich repeat protein
MLVLTEVDNYIIDTLNFDMQNTEHQLETYAIFLDKTYGGHIQNINSNSLDLGFCGDSKTEGTEQCDDGNIIPNDGCSASCQNEIRADVNQDGNINITDAQLTLRQTLGLDMSSTGWESSDTTGNANCDGELNITDIRLILRYSLGLNMTGTGWCE